MNYKPSKPFIRVTENIVLNLIFSIVGFIIFFCIVAIIDSAINDGQASELAVSLIEGAVFAIPFTVFLDTCIDLIMYPFRYAIYKNNMSKYLNYSKTTSTMFFIDDCRRNKNA
ncbi:hypothetical protein AVV36_gp148 [Pectobacterium bacteriophage PM2]|uniref:Uncharacterized protein n=1 Tax=Pectobacterium bacteriophage PM2 TaxID=1429794 RepID=A0A0A0Q2F6_9CAUD|nr:hypothetical protein AVV36_gp148 [Pectobacterium bacteriophage PM2]AHY25110.1 hypothetical protein PM2_148 [Pectobacterium bacteriophage PM2]